MAKINKNLILIYYFEILIFTLIFMRNSLAYQTNCSDGYFMASSNLCLPFDARCSQNQLYFNNNCYAITQGSCAAGEISLNNRCCLVTCITSCLQMQSCSCCNTLELYGKLCNQKNSVNLCPPCTMSNGRSCVLPQPYPNNYPCPIPSSNSYGLPCQQSEIGFPTFPPYFSGHTYPHPIYPTYPTNASHPIYPVYPTGPSHPIQPVNPNYTIHTPWLSTPIHPSHPIYPGHPNHPTYPTYSTSPTYPTYPIYSTHPTYPTYSTHPTYPSQPIQSTHPTHPIHPTHPTHSTHPTYSTRPTIPPGFVSHNCTNGTIYMNGMCHTIYCPYGTVLKNDRCIIAQCPDGTIWSNGRCILPQPIEHNIIINNTFTNQFNGSSPKSDIVINTYNNLSINSTINLDLNGDDKAYIPQPIPTQTQASITTSPSSSAAASASASASASPSASATEVIPITDAMANATNKCCIILSPRVCRPKAKNSHWICTSRRQHQCGEICMAPTIILIPPHIKQHHLNVTGKSIVVMPPEPICGTLCPSVKNYYDCSGCGIGHMEYCSSYCYHYNCPIQSCRFYEQQTYCAQNVGSFGCQFEDGCYDDDWC